MPIDRDQLNALIAAALTANLADAMRRPLLMAHIDPRIVAAIPSGRTPADQLRLDVLALNAHGALDTWLLNAADMTEPRLEADIFRAAASPTSGSADASDVNALAAQRVHGGGTHISIGSVSGKGVGVVYGNVTMGGGDDGE